MPAEILEVLRGGYAAFAHGDMSAVLDLLDPDFVVEVHMGPDADTYRGREGFVANIDRVRDVFEEFAIEPERFVEVGDRIVVPFRVHGRGRGSGVPVEQHRAHMWTLRGDRAVRLDVFGDADEALAAARAAGREQ